MILNEVFGQLSRIPYRLLADAVLNEGFLPQHIAAVLLVRQDGLEIAGGPLRRTEGVPASLGHKARPDISKRLSRQIHPIDLPDGLSLLRHDLHLTVRTFPVAQQVLILDAGPAVPHGLLNAPPDTGGCGLALRLRLRAEDGDEELAFRVDGVEAMLLEDDRNTKTPQLAGIVERVHGIPCKAGDGFGEDQVDLALSALPYHTQEVLALTGGGAGDALVGEYLHHGPFWIFHDLFRVVGKLVFVTGQLLLAVGGHAAVRRHPQVFLPFLLLRCLFPCGNYNDLSLRSCLDHELIPPSTGCFSAVF